jgi:hypothetical protein
MRNSWMDVEGLRDSEWLREAQQAEDWVSMADPELERRRPGGERQPQAGLVAAGLR